MIDPQPAPVKREAAPWTVACVTLLITFFSFAVIGPFIGFFFAYPFYSGDPMSFLTDLANPVGNEEMKMLYMIVQGCATLFGLAIIPALFWKAMTHRPIFSLFKGAPLKPVHFLMIIGVVIFYLGFLSVVMEWNQNVDLPDGKFETWARNLETQLGEVTKYLTSFTNFGQYLFGVLVIAVFAGIGEEMVFRGLVQPALFKATNNIHFAIWTSAFFFSALHMQFFGFFPRLFLGAVFGYLYYWSGNLIVPMFAHFVNNFLAVSLIYFGLSEVPGLGETTEQSAPWYVVVVMTAICGAIVYAFYKQFEKPENKSTSLDDLRS
jgi:membrane protease YdiL (CAAX protease family)